MKLVIESDALLVVGVSIRAAYMLPTAGTKQLERQVTNERANHPSVQEVLEDEIGERVFREFSGVQDL